jgi:hypothetical protein
MVFRSLLLRSLSSSKNSSCHVGWVVKVIYASFQKYYMDPIDIAKLISEDINVVDWKLIDIMGLIRHLDYNPLDLISIINSSSVLNSFISPSK